MQENKVENYIRKAAAFAQPVLRHIRKLVHLECPEIQETIKWGFPHFEYKGIILGMAAFKSHCTLTFWKAALINDKHGIMEKAGRSAMGQFGRMTSLNDLPPDKILIDYIRQAVKLNEENINLPAKKIAPAKKLVIPDYFEKALKKNKKAEKVFSEFSFSHQKEYIEWIIEAKKTETRDKRIHQALVMLSEEKNLHQKYKR